MRKLHIILALAFGPALIAACFALLMPKGAALTTSTTTNTASGPGGRAPGTT